MIKHTYYTLMGSSVGVIALIASFLIISFANGVLAPISIAGMGRMLMFTVFCANIMALFDDWG